MSTLPPIATAKEVFDLLRDDLAAIEAEFARDSASPVAAVTEILSQKLVKRGVSLKNLEFEKIEPAANSSVCQKINPTQRIPGDKAMTIVAAIKDAKLKAQASIQGVAVRVTSKDRDTLQSVIALLKGKDIGVDLQSTNYRSN